MDDEELREVVRRTCLQVAIDGPAGAGKSTVGSGLAARLGSAYLDTGLMYRAVAWLGMCAGIDASDGDALASLAESARFDSSSTNSILLVDGAPRDHALRSAEVDDIVSEVSAHRPVREALVTKQRVFADGRAVVMVGRDIGTTVLPGAPVKLWVTASAEERARRRLKEGLEGSANLTVDEVAFRIRARDAVDVARNVSPLRRAVDAHILETDSIDSENAILAAIKITRDTIAQHMIGDRITGEKHTWQSR